MLTRPLVTVVLILAVIGCTCGMAACSVIHVRTDGVDTNDGSTWILAKQTIGGALTAASSGDQIWVKVGTFNVSTSVTLKEAVNVYGGFAGTESSLGERVLDWESPSTIDGNGMNYSVVKAPSGVTVSTIFDGFKVTRGNGTLVSSSRFGGGIYVAGSGLTISNCHVEGNSADKGAGILAVTGTHTHIHDCYVADNDGTYGAGIYFYGGECLRSIITSNGTDENCDYGGGIMVGTQASDCRIEDTEISHNACAHRGGGVYVDVDGAPDITDCDLHENEAVDYGAGICTSNSSAVISGCSITNNKLYGTGGGRAGAGIAGTNSSTQVLDCTIEGNNLDTATGNYAAGIYFTTGSPIIHENIIHNNDSSASGAGVSFYNTTNFQLTENTIYGNDCYASGSGNGGGVSVTGTAYGNIERNIIYQNSAVGKGGGIILGSTSGTTTVVSNLIYSNSAAYGGGVDVNSGTATLCNNTIAGHSGDGVYVKYGATANLTNNIVASNTHGVETDNASTSFTFSHNDCYGNTSNYVTVSDQTGANGNICADPLFVSVVGYNYSLDSGSPCINAGDNTGIAVGDKDVAGNSRRIVTVDLGAYESVAGDTTAPSVASVSSPEGVEMAQGATIEVSYSGAADDEWGSGLNSVTLWCKHGAGSWAATDLTSENAADSFEFTPTSGWGTYYFAAVAQDKNNNYTAPTGDGDCSTSFFDNTPPDPGTLTSPAAVQITTGGTIDVTYAGAHDDPYGSGLADEWLWVKKEDTGTWENSGVHATGGSGTLTYTPTQGAGTYHFGVRATDVAGNQSAAITGAGQGSTDYYLPATMYAVWKPATGGDWRDPVNGCVSGITELRLIVPRPIGVTVYSGTGGVTVAEDPPCHFSTAGTGWRVVPDNERRAGDPTSAEADILGAQEYPWALSQDPHNAGHSVTGRVLGSEMIPPDPYARVWRGAMHIVFKNLTVVSCVPYGCNDQEPLVWKGEESATIPLTVTVDDLDLSVPYKLTLEIFSTKADNRTSWPAIRSITMTGCTGTTQTFYWDGKDGSGNYVEPWTYTYKVTAFRMVYPGGTVDAVSSNRSDYLQIIRATDPTTGEPIYDAEYAGYDDNGTTETEEDDNYLYYIRPYVLKDSLATTGTITESAGEIWLYDPDLEKVHTWNIANLPCRNHDDAHDGLNATAEGLQHDVLIKVPISKMAVYGQYRFVTHVIDSHADTYRNHEARSCKDLNAGLLKYLCDIEIYKPSVVDPAEGMISEADEETIGSVTFANLDNDDNDAVFDSSDSPVSVSGGDDELVKVKLKLRAKNLRVGTVNLLVGGTGSGIRLWSSATKEAEITEPHFPVWSFVSEGEYRVKTVWIEGISAHSYQRAVTLQMNYNGWTDIKDEAKLTVVGIQSVTWVGKSNSLTDGNILDADPNDSDNSVRVFPDSRIIGGSLEGSARDKVDVQVTLSVAPTHTVKVYLDSFDVDDPTANAYTYNVPDADIDFEDPFDQEDNRGKVPPVLGGNPAGKFTSETDGVAEMTFTPSDVTKTQEFQVTMQPGDNFRIAANPDKDYLGCLENKDSRGDGQRIFDKFAGTGTEILCPANYCSNKTLTVWRFLHIECDSMAAVDNANTKSGSIGSVDGTGPWVCHTNLDLSADDVDQYQNGKLYMEGIEDPFPVSGNTNTPDATVTVTGPISPGTGAFASLIDDDQATLPSIIDLGLLDKILKPCYVYPKNDLPGTTDVPFVLNVDDNIDDPNPAINAVCHWDSASYERPENNRFWGVYVLAGYQSKRYQDWDPSPETVPDGGACFGINERKMQRCIIYLETIRDYFPLDTAAMTKRIVAHEIAHQVGESTTHLDHTILEAGGPTCEEDEHFAPVDIGIIRSKETGPGKPWE